MEIKAAIFDFDGTLFDSMYVWKNVTEKYLNSIGLDAKGVDDGRMKSMSLLKAAQWVKDEFCLSYSTDEIMDGFNAIVKKEYLYNVLPKQGVEEFLKELKKRGVLMAVASVSEYEHIDMALKRCGLRDYFLEIFSCSSSQHGKKKPDVFNRALGSIAKADKGVNKENTFVFEDALYALEVAKNDGFRTVGVYDTSEAESDKMRQISDVYIEGFYKADAFWKIVENN